MSRTRLVQLIVVFLMAALTVFLYLMPISKPAKKEDHKHDASEGFSFETYFSDLNSQLDSLQLATVNNLEKKLQQNPDTNDYQAIAKIYDALRQPAASAFYYEKRAALIKSERSYLEAAYRYFDAFKAAGDTGMRAVMINHAIENYKMVVKLNPGNLDAKCDLGVLYTESGDNPMQGIMLLREVVKENPHHENAQFNLGLLSIKSGQYDKALERFDNVMKANNARIDMHVYKAQAYVEMGDTSMAIKNLNTFLDISKDEMMNEQVRAYVNELEKKQ